MPSFFSSFLLFLSCFFLIFEQVHGALKRYLEEVVYEVKGAKTLAHVKLDDQTIWITEVNLTKDNALDNWEKKDRVYFQYVRQKEGLQLVNFPKNSSVKVFPSSKTYHDLPTILNIEKEDHGFHFLYYVIDLDDGTSWKTRQQTPLSDRWEVGHHVLFEKFNFHQILNLDLNLKKEQEDRFIFIEGEHVK